MKYLVLLFTLLIFIGLGVTFWYFGIYMQANQNISPTSVQQQVAAVSPTSSTCDSLMVLGPKPGDKVTNPLSVNIIVDNTKTSCRWTVFEAQAGTAELRDSQGNLLGQGILRTTDDWTLPKPNPYNAVISYTQKPSLGNLVLIIREENPSDKPNPKEVTVTLQQ